MTSQTKIRALTEENINVTDYYISYLTFVQFSYTENPLIWWLYTVLIFFYLYE